MSNDNSWQAPESMNDPQWLDKSEAPVSDVETRKLIDSPLQKTLRTMIEPVLRAANPMHWISKRVKYEEPTESTDQDLAA